MPKSEAASIGVPLETAPAVVAKPEKAMKIIEITNVDFSLRHFLLPLMRAIRARGHEVVGACAEGPLLDDIRTEGFRIIPIPFVRRLSPLAHLQAFCSLVAILRAEKPDIGRPVCRSSPIPATASCSTTPPRRPRAACCPS